MPCSEPRCENECAHIDYSPMYDVEGLERIVNGSFTETEVNPSGNRTPQSSESAVLLLVRVLELFQTFCNIIQANCEAREIDAQELTSRLEDLQEEITQVRRLIARQVEALEEERDIADTYSESNYDDPDEHYLSDDQFYRPRTASETLSLRNYVRELSQLISYSEAGYDSDDASEIAAANQPFHEAVDALAVHLDYDYTDASETESLLEGN